MQWRHAFLPQGTTSQTAKDYEVDRIGLPRLVLVAPDGKVAAVQPDLSAGADRPRLRVCEDCSSGCFLIAYR